MRLASLFSDHAVLQRDIAIPVWGWTKPHSTVMVQLGSTCVQGIAADDGKFLVRLPAQPAGGPHVLEARNLQTDDVARVSNIHVGEVWLASGQSNMEWTLSATGAFGETEVPRSNDPLLRMFTAAHVAQLGVQRDVQGQWQPSGPFTAPSFSAVGYYFAKRLRRELGVAVGIINSSWGGTIAEAWTARQWLVRNAHLAALVARYESDVFDPDFQKVQQARQPSYPADPGNRGLTEGWARLEVDPQGWRDAELPNSWQALGHNGSGVYWFRKTVQIPAAWAGKTLTLRIGAVDKQDITYFNGEQVGAMGSGLEDRHWNTLRHYEVPGRLVKAGPSTIAVRAYSFVYQGGMIGPNTAMTLAPADGSDRPLPLAGTWSYRQEHDFGMVTPAALPPGPGNANTPYILHDCMIAPLQPYALRGAIWYQGESNAARADEYQALMTDLIRCWRHGWGQGDFPFLFVQLANYMAPEAYQPASTWARLRDAQRRTLSEPNTGMAVIVDIGEKADIHPRNKHDVGDRLARWALSGAYRRPVVASGPLYESISIEGKSIRVRFSHAEGGLVAEGGPLQTFHLAGADRRFRPATAVIDGQTVVVSSPEVPAPVAVRYAWADNPVGCNLRNAEGLPASPFRSDAWA